MKDAYSIVCSKSIQHTCQENKLSATGYGKQLPSTIHVVSDHSENGIRTVSLTRNISFSEDDYFTFPTTAATISTIHAIGTNDTFTSSTPHMGPGGASKLVLKDGVSNNLTTSNVSLGTSIRLNAMAIYPDQDMVRINVSGPARS